MEPTAHFRLFDLPRELRDLIYEAVIDLPTQVNEERFRDFRYYARSMLRSREYRSRLTCRLLSTKSPTLNLMQTSRRVYAETISMFNRPEIVRLACVDERSSPRIPLPRELCQLDDIKASRKTWHAIVDFGESYALDHQTTAYWTRIPCPQIKLENLFVPLRLPTKRPIAPGVWLPIEWRHRVPVNVIENLLRLLVMDGSTLCPNRMSTRPSLVQVANVVLDLHLTDKIEYDVATRRLRLPQLEEQTKDLLRSFQTAWRTGMFQKSFKNLIIVSWLDERNASFFDVANHEPIGRRHINKPL